MIDDVRLRRIASEEKVPLGTIEKDFAISCALYVISNSKLRDHLMFKGGTAIKKVYNPDARFSEDMDFTVSAMTEEEAIFSLRELFSDRNVETISFGRAYEERFSQSGRSLRLPFTGPLEFRNSIKVDLSFRGDLILEVRELPVLSKYGESVSSTVSTLEFIEIIAEKLRALMYRGYPRDYYDVWFHIGGIQDKDYLKALTKRKCSIIDLEYKSSNIFDEAILTRVESEWKTKLQHLLPHYINFKNVLFDLKVKLDFL